ncbi:MAG TPA: OmpH family outer membrane protein [Acidobacteriota bacterium]
MRRIFLMAVFVSGIFHGVSLAQQPAAKPAPTKVGAVDIARALGDTAEGQREFANVQNWVNAQQDALKREETEYNALRNRYMQDQLKMSAEARADTERQLQDRETRLRRKQEDLNQELGLRRQAIVNRLGTKLQGVIQQYALDNNYLMILIAQDGLLAYLAPGADLTGQLVKLYDAKYPIAASAPKKP